MVDHLSRADAKVVDSAIMLILRSLWLERNARVFNDTTTPYVRVLDDIVQEWSLWLSCRHEFVRGVP
jgi:hypothetical protein